MTKQQKARAHLARAQELLGQGTLAFGVKQELQVLDTGLPIVDSQMQLDDMPLDNLITIAGHLNSEQLVFLWFAPRRFAVAPSNIGHKGGRSGASQRKQAQLCCLPSFSIVLLPTMPAIGRKPQMGRRRPHLSSTFGGSAGQRPGWTCQRASGPCSCTCRFAAAGP